MAAKPQQEEKAALAADSDAVIPRITLGEQGFIGLRNLNGQIVEETNRAFRYPAFLKTVEEMSNDAIIASAMNVYRMFLSRVTWRVDPPIDATPQQIERAKFIASLMEDMDGSWGSFIEDVTNYLWYGFSIQEKVYRRRLRKNGSLHNDGLIGLKKLSPRGQDTIRHWRFTEDGSELVKVEQSLRNLENGYKYVNVKTNKDGLVDIQRDKFLLFSADSTKGNPEGRSLLKGVYLAWKQMTLLKDQELLSVAKDAAGLPLIQIPPKYMDPNASPEDKAVYEMCKMILNNLAAGTQRGIIFPTMIDPETNVELFKVSLLEKKGLNIGVDTIIKRYQDEVLAALSVDILRSGGNPGSFSLNDGDTSVLTIALSHRLTEIANVLNEDLVKQVFALNGWTDSVLPKFVPNDISTVSLEELSKFLQRVASTGLLEVDREVLNKVRVAMGVQPKPDYEPVDKEALSTNVSNSGKGMEVGTSGDGTAKIGGNSSGQDRSSNNNDNKA